MYKIVEKWDKNAVYAIVYSVERFYNWVEYERKKYFPDKEFILTNNLHYVIKSI